jgi:6-phosphogluconolactonase
MHTQRKFAALVIIFFLTTMSRAESIRVFLGTYTGGESKGIYTSMLDLESGEMTPIELAGEAINPSFLAIHPTGKYLYCVGEIAEFEGKPTGGVTAFAINREAGTLTKLNQQSSAGGGPCHIVVDPTGKAALVANYGGGSVASLPIGDDGKLAPPASKIQHEGKSVNPQRQEGPHAHSINLDPANHFAFAADLGLDKVLIYRFDPTTAKLTPNDPAAADVAPGAGPRHFAFHPTGKFAYVINELANTVTAFAYDPDAGKLTEVQTIKTLPDDFTSDSYTAEVVVHPSGKFVYGSNRRHDTIAAFQVDESTGKLTAIGHTPTGGKEPRNFAIEPGGKWLLAANQNSHTVFVFRIDEASGKLESSGHSIECPSPVCVRFLK